MAAVGTSMIQHLQSQSDTRVKIQDQSDEDTSDEINITASRDSCSPRTELDTAKEHQANQAPSLQSSSFSMQNVLKMKTERDSVSPELNQNVFSTDKLLQNTPSYENQIDTSIQSNHPSSEYSPNYSRTSIPTSSPRYDNGDESDYPTASERDLNVDDALSCCSEDTVLSVGNEAPILNFNDVQGSTPLQKSLSPRTSPLQNLTSFKHIQTHLNAISQLSQNLNINQPVLLRPNPINPNPLLFLNQTHLLFSGSQVQNPALESKIGSLSSRVGLNQANQIGPGNPFNTSGVNLRQFKQPAFSGQILGKSMDDTKKNVCNLNLNNNISNNNSSNSPINLDSVNEESRRDIILNQNCLKFSIDNILKADFGRRITDPLMKRKSSISKSRSTHSSSATSGYSNSDLLTSKEPGTVNDFNVKTGKFFSSGTVQLDKPVSLDTRLSCEVDSKVGSGSSGEKNGAIDLSKSDDQNSNQGSSSSAGDGPMVWPAWVYCTRYSDRPSSGPRTRRPKKPPGDRSPAADEKRPRTAFSGPQLARLKHEFNENRYLTERRRQQLASELGLAEAQIKIWFQNKRAKIKKASGQRNPWPCS